MADIQERLKKLGQSGARIGMHLSLPIDRTNLGLRTQANMTPQGMIEPPPHPSPPAAPRANQPREVYNDQRAMDKPRLIDCVFE